MSLEYDDDSIMPFGKHKGKTLEDVPASYFIWLQGELRNKSRLNQYEKALLDYIIDNQDVLDKQAGEENIYKKSD